MGDVLGKYRIDGIIAEGGMARIYRAKTEGIGGVEKVVALKCIKGAMSEDDNYVRMLLDEARITARMTHKNICQVYGLEHDGDTYFMVMELVDGASLANLANHLFGLNRVFPIEAAVFIAMEVCAGLSYAHRMTDDDGEPLGIVHRDVNPQNICISKEGEVKLIDFGIAKAKRMSSGETQAGTIKGKFNYMSPEQARGDRVDQRADVFALGAVLYEMLCGHMLYPLTLDDMRLRTKTRMADFVPIENYLPSVPEKLRLILAKALARDVNQRFASSRDFLLALTQFFHDSCKVYDSINLSLLVEKYLLQKGKTRNSSPGAQKKPVIARKDNPDMLIESGDTTVMNADDARRIATGTPSGELYPTAVYLQPSFKSDPAPPQESDDCAVARSVDLSVATPGTDSTVMVNMRDVKGQNRNSLVVFSEFVNQKIQSMSEKTLAIVAASLTILLIAAIVLFMQLRNASDDNGGESFAEDADSAQAF